MFRRIELIEEERYKHGICGPSHASIEFVEVWLDMTGPKHLHKNCKFYFTEYGWEIYGRRMLAALGKCDETRCRVLAVKERAVDIFYRDAVQVAVRARRACRKDYIR